MNLTKAHGQTEGLRKLSGVMWESAGTEVTRPAIAATLRRYRAEWQAALARRDYATTRTILGAALSAVSEEASANLNAETRALNELLALGRRVQDIADGEAPVRFPPSRQAFATPSTRRFRRLWDRAIEGKNHVVASKVLQRAIAALSGQIATRARSQQVLIDRLRRLQRTPLQFSLAPARCAFCGGAQQPGVDSGGLFICMECIQSSGSTG
jgi:hypothetical protein